MEHQRSLLAVLAASLSLVLYGWTLWYGEFFSDDFAWLWYGQQFWESPWRMLTERVANFYTPVINLTFTLFYHWFGYWTTPYFLLSLTVHAAVSVLIGLLAFNLTNSRGAAVLATALASVVGPAYEPLVWVASTLHSIVALLAVASLLAYQRFLLGDRSRYLVWSFAFFLLALATKEIAIVTPLLMALTWLLYPKETVVLSQPHRNFVGAVALVTVAYGAVEYLWQRSSSTLTSGLWAFDVTELLRLPFLLTDLLLPLAPLLTTGNAVVVWLITTTLLLTLLLVCWPERLVRLGFSWAVAATLPTIFFGTATWWGLLASRYAYLPRLGMVLVAVGLYQTVRQRTFPRVLTTMLLGLLVAYQIAWMGLAVWRDYGVYIYKTGQTLQLVAQEIKARGVERVLVAPDRPFEQNPAHVVGALATIAGVAEKDIVFLASDAVRPPVAGEAFIVWDPFERSYQVEFGE